MMRGFRALSFAGVLALTARVAIGCATADDPNDAEPRPDDDASVTPAGDGSADDASADGDATGDAASPTCSADGWCYTALPAEDSYDGSALSATPTALTFGLRSVWVAPDHRAWAVTSVGHVLLWDGTAWHVKAILNGELSTVWGSGENEIWVGGERGLVMRGTVTGSEVTFQKATLSSTQMIGRIVGTSPSNVWAIADGVNGFGTRNRVWRLNPIIGADPPSFSPLTVPSSLPGPSPSLRISALWTSGSTFWLAGYETTCFGPRPCTFMENLLALKWKGPSDGGPEWDQVPFRSNESHELVAATATPDDVQILAIREQYGGDDAIVARVADDPSKLYGSDGGATDGGAYSWAQEFVDYYGEPKALWAANRSDVWLVGKSGLVRHFDGTSWKRIRTSLTNVTPLLQDLYSIHAVIAPSGEQDIWIVGDDVALHQTVKP